jgi:hypothetical protein
MEKSVKEAATEKLEMRLALMKRDKKIFEIFTPEQRKKFSGAGGRMSDGCCSCGDVVSSNSSYRLSTHSF